MCTATNLLRKVTLNIYSRIQLKLIYYIKATENEDVLKGKAKESRGFLKSGPTFPKSVPEFHHQCWPPGNIGNCLYSLWVAGQKILWYMGLCQAHSSASFNARVTAQHPVVHKSPVTSLSALERVALKLECLLESLGALVNQ